MIKTISASGGSVQILGGVASAGPYINTSGVVGTTPLMIGAVRFDSSSQGLQVWDGYNWLNIYYGHATVCLNPEAESAIKWARQKQQEEQDLEQLIERSPALRDAYEKFQIVKQLATNENKPPA